MTPERFEELCEAQRCGAFIVQSSEPPPKIELPHDEWLAFLRMRWEDRERRIREAQATRDAYLAGLPWWRRIWMRRDIDTTWLA